MYCVLHALAWVIFGAVCLVLVLQGLVFLELHLVFPASCVWCASGCILYPAVHLVFSAGLFVMRRMTYCISSLFFPAWYELCCTALTPPRRRC